MRFIYNMSIRYAKVLLRTFGRETLAETQTRFCLFCATAHARKVTFFKTIIKPKVLLSVK